MIETRCWPPPFHDHLLKLFRLKQDLDVGLIGNGDGIGFKADKSYDQLIFSGLAIDHENSILSGCTARTAPKPEDICSRKCFFKTLGIFLYHEPHQLL